MYDACRASQINAFVRCAVCKMSDRGEAYLSANGSEEDVFIDKETINCQFNILLELDELLGNLDNTLRHALAVPSHSVPFHLENKIDPKLHLRP